MDTKKNSTESNLTIFSKNYLLSSDSVFRIFFI